MKLCVISFKECWRDTRGAWWSSGGFPLQVAALATLFDAVTLVVVENFERPGGLPLPAGARVVPLRAPAGSDLRRKIGFLGKAPTYLAPLTHAIRACDVVHTPLPGDIPLLGLFLAVLFRKRLVARYGGSWTATAQTTWMNRVTRGAMRAIAGGRNVMLATGDASAAPAPGIEWVFATALSRAELAQTPADLDRGWSDPPRLAYVGRLSPEKGVAKLIAAVQSLRSRARAPLPRIQLVGDGPQRPELERAVHTAGLADVFVFAGQQDRDGLSRELSQADICIQPSLSEGYSKAWLDAMAHGLPVLASEVGAARAVIGGSGLRGWLVPPGDVDALCATLEEILLAPPDWPDLRRRCRGFAESRTLEAWSDRIGEICARQWRGRVVQGRLEVCPS